jgi:hypothetical protein
VDLIVFQLICQQFFSKTRILAGIVVPFLFFSLNASAQSYIGGSFSLGNSTVGRNQTATTWTRSTSFRLAPDLGWFIGDRWAVGIRPSVGFSSTINSDDVQSKSFSLGINPYARYRLLAHHRFGLWAEADPKISFEQVKSQARGGGWPSKSHSTFYDMDILPVLTYQLSRHISLESPNLSGESFFHSLPEPCASIWSFLVIVFVLRLVVVILSKTQAKQKSQ